MSYTEIVQLKKLAETGDDEAKYELAIHLFNGDACNKDISGAIQFLEEACCSSNRARKLLAYYYITGQIVEKNIDKGIDLLQKAAMDLDDEACKNLGVMYYSGIEIKRNKEIAESWFNLSNISKFDLFKLKVNLSFSRTCYRLGSFLKNI